LVALAAQYRGKHNGHLRLTGDICAGYGIHRSQASRDAKELTKRGLIVKTCAGGKRPRPPTQYAVTWRPITHRNNDLLDKPEPASNAWAKWRAPAAAGGQLSFTDEEDAA